MARASFKGILGAMMVGSSRRPYVELNESTTSEDELPELRLSTTNTESLDRTTRAAGCAGSQDRSRLFDASKTTSFSDHYVMELCEDSLLGVGSSAQVRICTEIHTGEKLACKMISKLNLSSRQRQRIINEAKIHSFLSGHPHVVRLADVCEDDDCVYIIMEHCKGGHLLKILREQETLPEAKAANIMTMLAEFLLFCHQQGVVHRDLKPENILLNDKYSRNDLPSIKVADFGHAFQSTISDHPGTTVSSRTHFLGSHGYIAPEMLRGESYGPPIDVWSAGIVLCNLLSGEMPFTRDDYQDLRENRAELDFHRNGNWRAVPTEAQSLIAGMLTLDPAARMTADQISVHPWIKKHAKKRDAKGKRAAFLKKLPKFRGSRSGSDSCFGGSPAPRT